MAKGKWETWLCGLDPNGWTGDYVGRFLLLRCGVDMQTDLRESGNFRVPCHILCLCRDASFAPGRTDTTDSRMTMPPTGSKRRRRVRLFVTRDDSPRLHVLLQLRRSSSTRRRQHSPHRSLNDGPYQHCQLASPARVFGPGRRCQAQTRRPTSQPISEGLLRPFCDQRSVRRRIDRGNDRSISLSARRTRQLLHTHPELFAKRPGARITDAPPLRGDQHSPIATR